MTALTTVVARILFAVPFAIFGIIHFTKASQMAGAVPKWVPGPGIFWIYFFGVALIACSIGLITKKYGYWAALALALMLATFVLTLHLPGGESHLSAALKDSALCGGALTWAGLLKAHRK